MIIVEVRYTGFIILVSLFLYMFKFFYSKKNKKEILNWTDIERLKGRRLHQLREMHIFKEAEREETQTQASHRKPRTQLTAPWDANWLLGLLETMSKREAKLDKDYIQGGN